MWVISYVVEEKARAERLVVAQKKQVWQVACCLWACVSFS